MTRYERNYGQEFERVALPLMSSLYNCALRLTRDQYDAEDIVQETYLKAFRFFYRFKKGTNIHGWMVRILTNIFITKFNELKRQPAKVNIDKVFSFTPQTDHNQFDNYTEEEYIQNYHELFEDSITIALDKLPGEYLIIVLLCDVCGLKYKEIAKTLDLPLGTVMPV